VKARSVCAAGLAALLLLTACVTARRPPGSETSAVPAAATVDALAAAIKLDADRSDREPDAGARAKLAADATRTAQSCLARQPRAAACLYGRAVAQGLEAKAHPTRASGLLKSMLESLTDADQADPQYDHAGPARVRALVLIRAPGWPLGPGDLDSGLAEARRAVMLSPGYPPNLLALAEALAKSGDRGAASDSYARAREAAQALPESADRQDWLKQAAGGLQQNQALPRP